MNWEELNRAVSVVCMQCIVTCMAVFAPFASKRTPHTWSRNDDATQSPAGAGSFMKAAFPDGGGRPGSCIIKNQESAEQVVGHRARMHAVY